MAAAVLDNCVCLYAFEEWDKLVQGLNDMPLTEARVLQRYLSSNAKDVTVDSQGRVLLPKHLLAYGKLEKDVLVVGVGNRAEIWNPAAYDDSVGAMTSDKVEAAFRVLGF
jgi:MraZ protein